jgi:hypothetical protein
MSRDEGIQKPVVLTSTPFFFTGIFLLQRFLCGKEVSGVFFQSFCPED